MFHQVSPFWWPDRKCTKCGDHFEARRGWRVDFIGTKKHQGKGGMANQCCTTSTQKFYYIYIYIHPWNFDMYNIQNCTDLHHIYKNADFSRYIWSLNFRGSNETTSKDMAVRSRPLTRNFIALHLGDILLTFQHAQLAQHIRKDIHVVFHIAWSLWQVHPRKLTSNLKLPFLERNKNLPNLHF